MLFPASMAEHTVESLHAQVELAVRAPGVVRPIREKTDLRVAVSGQIAEVLASDNRHVAAGEPLLVLRSRDLEERRALNGIRQGEKAGLVVDLEKLVANPAGLLDLGMGLQVAELLADAAEVEVQLEVGRLDAARAGREQERMEALATHGLVTQRELDGTRFEAGRIQAEHTLRARSAHARWAARLAEERAALAALVAEGRRLTEESVGYTLRAPVAGTVQGLAGLSPGGWLVAGQSVGAVSPDERLVVEVRLSPRDIGLVRRGQTARMQVDAFPHTQWGMLDGTVVAVADDAASLGAAGAGTSPLFKIIVQRRVATLWRSNGAAGRLRKGMTLNARFIVARRSLLEVLFEDASSWLNPQDRRSLT